MTTIKRSDQYQKFMDAFAEAQKNGPEGLHMVAFAVELADDRDEADVFYGISTKPSVFYRLVRDFLKRNGDEPVALALIGAVLAHLHEEGAIRKILEAVEENLGDAENGTIQ